MIWWHFSFIFKRKSATVLLFTRMIAGNNKSLKLDGSNISSMNILCLPTFLLLISRKKKHSRANFHSISNKTRRLFLFYIFLSVGFWWPRLPYFSKCYIALVLIIFATKWDFWAALKILLQKCWRCFHCSNTLFSLLNCMPWIKEKNNKRKLNNGLPFICSMFCWFLRFLYFLNAHIVHYMMIKSTW